MKIDYNKVERMMIRKGLRRTDVFGLSGNGLISNGTCSRIRRGSDVSCLTAFKLCKLLGCDIDEIALDMEVPTK